MIAGKDPLYTGTVYIRARQDDISELIVKEDRQRAFEWDCCLTCPTDEEFADEEAEM